MWQGLFKFVLRLGLYELNDSLESND